MNSKSWKVLPEENEWEKLIQKENRHAIPSLEKKNEESHKQELFICFTRKKRKTTKVKTIPDLDNRKENAKLKNRKEKGKGKSMKRDEKYDWPKDLEMERHSL